MQKLIFLFAAGLVVAMAACNQVRPPQEACVGFVTKIEEHPGAHYSPAKGHEPLTSVFVELIRAEGKSAGAPLRILVLGLFHPSTLGNEGDTVRFMCPRHSLKTGTVWFDELEGYRIVSRMD